MLFDLETDPSERTNLTSQHPAKLRELRVQLANWEADIDRSPPPFVIR